MPTVKRKPCSTDKNGYPIVGDSAVSLILNDITTICNNNPKINNAWANLFRMPDTRDALISFTTTTVYRGKSGQKVPALVCQPTPLLLKLHSHVLAADTDAINAEFLQLSEYIKVSA